MNQAVLPKDFTWSQFVLAYGWRASGGHLAAVLGRDLSEIERLRRSGGCKRLCKAKGFNELFSLWHGRAPTEEEWPAPRKLPRRRTYEWQSPEIVLLASLVGRLGKLEISQTLTRRLRERTGDPEARRTAEAIQQRIALIGLQSTDVIGGITTAAAAREIGSLPVINHAIRTRRLRAVRVGRLWVIPHEVWTAWKAKRAAPPAGFIPLSSIRESLAIRSDKLSEFARMGYVPTAVRCVPFGVTGPSTQFGSWYIDEKIAKQLLADRLAGRAMPWHGKPLQDNLRVTFKLWQTRQHPGCCRTCAEIWGKTGAPATFDEYVKAYPPLARGAKRHLTRPWDPGVSPSAVAADAGRTVKDVRRAIQNGMLQATSIGRQQYISRADATRWKTRKCPTGDSAGCWISLDTARKRYLFTRQELRGLIARGTLLSRIGTYGAMRGVVYVSKHQCRTLREEIGFSQEEAARRLGVSVTRVPALLEGLEWRKAQGIPLETVRAAIKRLQSREGYTVEEAAGEVGMSIQWVLDRTRDGTIKILRAKWDRRRAYITRPMLKRLQRAKTQPSGPRRLHGEWLPASRAALEAGVTSTTITRWVASGELARRQSRAGWRYHRQAVRARARAYWSCVRFRRATPPGWLAQTDAQANASAD